MLQTDPYKEDYSLLMVQKPLQRVSPEDTANRWQQIVNEIEMMILLYHKLKSQNILTVKMPAVKSLVIHTPLIELNYLKYCHLNL